MAARPRARVPRATLIATALLTALIALALAPRAEAFVYWANIDAGTIGRANLDGTGVDKSFITGVSASVPLAQGFCALRDRVARGVGGPRRSFEVPIGLYYGWWRMFWNACGRHAGGVGRPRTLERCNS